MVRDLNSSEVDIPNQRINWVAAVGRSGEKTRMKRIAHRALLTALVLILAGCASMRDGGVGDEYVDPELAIAENYFRNGDYGRAMIACIDIARDDPNRPGLVALQHEITKAMHEERVQAAAVRNSMTNRRMSADIDRKKAIPHTYNLRRLVAGETTPLRTPSTEMEQVLRKKINVHLDNVSLNSFVLALGASENVNIIVDGELANSDKTMTLHADDAPLVEILDYASRNLEVDFSVGRNIIWATPGQGTDSAVPMETRMYRLRKGLSGTETAAGGDSIDIVRAVEQFVIQEEGASLMFNSKAHVLLARNTRENLSLIEDLIETLDVTPPQILIEARFISTSINDLSELGIDWILDSSIPVTKKEIWQYGVRETVTETQIAADPGEPSLLSLGAFPNAALGMNLAYQGVLTDPAFRATLHALEQSGKARTLSVPRVTTVNNREATMRIGEDFLYFEEYDIRQISSVTDVGNVASTERNDQLVPVGTPTKKELGIQLAVTPSVGADKRSITLLISPEISDFVRWERYATAGSGTSSSSTDTNRLTLVQLPVFRTSQVDTEVVVRSGETVVMGGLITSAETRTENRIPILSAIPLIGRLFRHDIVEQEKKNLLIFVTASIISEWGETLIPTPDGMPGARSAPEVVPPAVGAVAPILPDIAAPAPPPVEE